MSADVVRWVRAHHRDTVLPGGLVRLSGGMNNGVYAAAGVCVKLYKIDDRCRWEREWRALTLLADAGLKSIPQPLWYDPDWSPPAVVMELLLGQLLHEIPIGSPELTALGDALITLYHVPGVDTYPTTVIGTPTVFIEQIALTAERLRHQEHDLLAQESAARLHKWLALGDQRILAKPAPPAFSRGDANLANCLWDGNHVRIVDFEYAGRSDIAFDLG